MGKGQRVGYIRVSSAEQNTARQLENAQLDETFSDKASGKDRNRPALDALLKHVRRGDTVLVHSMDRMARNLDDLRQLVKGLTGRGVRVEFLKEALTFTGDDTPMSEMMLSIIGAVAQFERSMILERQREGIAIAKAAGKYRGGQRKLTPDKAESMCKRIADGVSVAKAAREAGITRQGAYAYLKPEARV